ncbi:MAG: hypothetical protein JSS75_07315 [Bacteroidetes bacterium]|nr:hypothetical protein [Bacteroidota bacterium]
MTDTKNEQLYDVFAVNIRTGEERFMDGNMTEENAQAYVKMAVWRHGVDEEFFKYVPQAQEHTTPSN